MKVLVVGSGGREHALAWKLAQSPDVIKLYCAPGSDAIASVAECVPIKVEALDEIVDFVKENKIGLAVIGPEVPLVLGISGKLEEIGCKVFGPSKEAAQIEGSKAFAKQLMDDAQVPTARYGVFTDLDKARLYLLEVGAPVVIKADGLAAGKGVYVCREISEATDALDEIMNDRVFGEAGAQVVIEEFLEGEEASLLALVDGENVLPLASSQDHKPAFDGDKGPNTGGMGAYSPAPVLDGDMLEKAVEQVIRPVVDVMKDRGTPYKGVLYAGLMIKDGVPKVLEFNCRFGDPETQPIMARLGGDILPALVACADGKLDEIELAWKPQAAVCVVMASGGYPASYEKGKVIKGIEDAEAMQDVIVFHAGTKKQDGQWVNTGGRVLGVTALGDSVSEAQRLAYQAVKKISWEKVHYRMDIADKALNRK